MGEENKDDQKKEETKKLEEPLNPSEGSDSKSKKDNESAPATEEDAAKKDESAAAAAAEPPEIVLKVDMHCEACARKVARALKGFQGVEEVIADSKASKVVVKGKAADPVKVFERLQKKSGKKVELISPLPKPPEPAADQDEVKPQDQNDASNKDQKDQEKKDEPPTPITVVLNVRMHCEACAQGLQKRVRKIKGVESVETDLHGGQVTVKGIFDPEKLVEYVKKRTGKQASIVKEEEKKESAEEKKEEEKKDVVEEKKEEEQKEGDEVKGDDEGDDIKRSEYWPKYYTEYHAYPPQMFSDENPNACSVM